MFRIPTLTSLIAVASLTAVAPALADAPRSPVVRDQRTAQVEIRDHRTAPPVVRDHRVPSQNEVVIVGQGDFDCRYGAILLFRMGYDFVNPYDCDGAIYHYTAMDGAALFHAAMSSHSGDVQIELVGISN